MDPHRPTMFFRRHLAEIDERLLQPIAHVLIGCARQVDRARLANALQARGDVDAVAHQVAVALRYDVAEMDADAVLDALFRRQSSISLDHAVLHFNRAAHRVDHAAEFDDCAVAGSISRTRPRCTATVGSIRSLRRAPQARQRPVFISADKPAEAHHIGGEDRHEFPAFARGLRHFGGEPSPPPATVTIMLGCLGSGSILRRSRMICMSMLRS